MIKFNKFPEGKSKIVTMSYDDGAIHDYRLVEIFNKYKIRGAFHLNSGYLGDSNHVSKEDVKTLFNGHEVSLHTYTHPFLNTVPNETLVKEIMMDREILESLAGYIVKGMSYPFGAYDKATIEKLKMMGVVYSRTTKNTNGFELPADFMEWHPTCHHSQNAIELSKEFINSLDITYKHNLLYIWGHSYEFNNNNNWDLIEEICKNISGYEEIWYATNIEIYNYVIAQRMLQISADQKMLYNPAALDVWVSVDNETVKISSGETVIL